MNKGYAYGYCHINPSRQVEELFEGTINVCGPFGVLGARAINSYLANKIETSMAVRVHNRDYMMRKRVEDDLDR